MANPQKENGYTAIANEILETLIGTGLNGTELACVLHVLRQTYGYHKTQDAISVSQFEKHIPSSKRTIKNALKVLQLVKILTLVKKGNSKTSSNVWAFNKNYTEWQLVQKTALVQKITSTSAEKRNQLVKKTAPTKETIQKKLKKAYIPTQELVEQFNHDFELLKLTSKEMVKLYEKFGGELRTNLVKFENAIGAKDYKYKSHYRAMLNWYDKPKTPEFYREEANRLAFPTFYNKHGEDLANKYFSNK